MGRLSIKTRGQATTCAACAGLARAGFASLFFVLAVSVLCDCGPRTGTIACEGAAASIIEVIAYVVVSDIQGHRLCGATVAASVADGGSEFHLAKAADASSADCAFWAVFAPGTYDLLVSSPGYVTSSKTVVVLPCSSGQTFDVALVALRDGGASD